jgi:predicted GTPase
MFGKNTFFEDNNKILLEKEEIENKDKYEIIKKLSLEYQKNNQEINTKPSILLAGSSGVGKSSLINAIFGDNSITKGILHFFKKKVGIGKGITLGTSKNLKKRNQSF